MCFDDTVEFRKRIGAVAFDICTDKIIEKSADLSVPCDFEERISGQSPTCPVNSVYDGCATSCDFMTCDEVIANENNFLPSQQCEDNGKKIAGCRCADGFFLENSVCVPYVVINSFLNLILYFVYQLLFRSIKFNSFYALICKFLRNVLDLNGQNGVNGISVQMIVQLELLMELGLE